MFNMLTNTKILLIGASGDLGQAMSKRFLAEGAEVIGTSHRHPERLASFTGADGGRFQGLQMDVTKQESIDEAFKIIRESGPLHAMVYNVGITKDNPTLGMENEDWESVIDTNLNGAFRCTRTFGRLFFRQRSGRLLFISSVAGMKGGRGQANYAAAKAGLEGFIRSLAADMAPRGILVNGIAPGPVESLMTKDVMTLVGEAVLRQMVLKRLARPEEIAAAVAHVLSPDMTYLTGQTISIDGGFGIAG